MLINNHSAALLFLPHARVLDICNARPPVKNSLKQTPCVQPGLTRLQTGEKNMFDKLVKVICNYVEVEPQNIHLASRFMKDLEFTSFDFMSMLGEIEDEFDIEIEQAKAANIRKVGEAVYYLEKLTEEA